MGSRAPAHFAAGYLHELTGEDMEEYIIGCYEVDHELTVKVLEAMDQYRKKNRENEKNWQQKNA